ncbi:MAG: histone H1 [Actinobacteria bacterium]|nr:histone H1 [Actinomycetota bacterium]
MLKRPRDLNQLAASIVRDTTEDEPGEPSPETVEGAQRRENGRRGGLKGGRVRAERLSSEQRSEIARKAARARWGGRNR